MTGDRELDEATMKEVFKVDSNVNDKIGCTPPISGEPSHHGLAPTPLTLQNNAYHTKDLGTCSKNFHDF